MFALYFNPKPVRNLDDATGGSIHLFKDLFKYLINHGVYLPPSPYETCFISAAHKDSDIEKTLDCVRGGFASF